MSSIDPGDTGPDEAAPPGNRYKQITKARRLALAERRTRIARLYLRGRTQTEIAVEIGVAQATVCRDIQALHTEWRARRVEDVSILKVRELARIDEIERESWAEWERSKATAESTTTEQSAGGEGTKKRVRVLKTTKPQCGDPRYLHVIERGVETRRKLLGLETLPDADALGALESLLNAIAPRLMRQVREHECNPVMSLPDQPGQDGPGDDTGRR